MGLSVCGIGDVLLVGGPRWGLDGGGRVLGVAASRDIWVGYRVEFGV